MKKLLYILILPLILFLVSCGSGEEDEPILSIGDEYGGGIIFWLDASGEHGLIVAKTSYSSKYKWGCPEILINGASGTGVGTGFQNTLDIISECFEPNGAAFICANSSRNGYIDWYLPSIDELQKIYQNLHLQGVGNLFLSYNSYWSSSEVESSNAPNEEKAYNFGFEDGSIYPTDGDVNDGTGILGGSFKSETKHVRQIRSF